MKVIDQETETEEVVIGDEGQDQDPEAQTEIAEILAVGERDSEEGKKFHR